MNIKRLGKLAILLMILLCLIGVVNVSAEYIYGINKKELETSMLNQIKEAQKEEQEEQKKQEEEQKQQEQAQTIQVQRTNQSYTPQLSGNNIIIPGVLSNNLMKDYDGNDFYLYRDINGNYNGVGTPYIDFRTNFQTRKTLIYAHSSPSGNGPFNALQNYHNNPGYYYGHRYITINFNGSTYTYEIFSVYTALASSYEDEALEYYYRTNYNDTEWAEAIQNYKNKSEYETGVSVSANDNILILQTCSMDPAYYGRYYRYNLLIMAKLV